MRNLLAFDAAKQCLGPPCYLAAVSDRLCNLHVGLQANSRLPQLGMPSKARPVGKSKRGEACRNFMFQNSRPRELDE